MRKIWNSRNFKGHVSPHELLQAISIRSGKKFRLDEQSNPLDLLVWFLNNLHREFLKNKNKSTIIHDCFQGIIEINEIGNIYHLQSF
jgi:U4/U6.U5 tri-snRNP-associated protein 2